MQYAKSILCFFMKNIISTMTFIVAIDFYNKNTAGKGENKWMLK